MTIEYQHTVPVKKPKTSAVLSLRVDIRLLAMLADFLTLRNASPTSMSDIVKVSLELFAQMLKQKGLAKEVESYEQAYKTCYGIRADWRNRAKNQMLRLMAGESFDFTEGEVEASVNVVNSGLPICDKVTSDLLAQAKQIASAMKISQTSEKELDK